MTDMGLKLYGARQVLKTWKVLCDWKIQAKVREKLRCVGIVVWSTFCKYPSGFDE